MSQRSQVEILHLRCEGLELLDPRNVREDKEKGVRAVLRYLQLEQFVLKFQNYLFLFEFIERLLLDQSQKACARGGLFFGP